MPSFGSHSKKQRATLDKRLQKILDEAIEYFDFQIVEGHRGKAAQDKAFATGASKLRWPYGNHNKMPSLAADLAPWPIDWSNKATALARFAFLMGVIHKVAKDQGTKVRFGLDWNRNLDPRDESFVDWGHVELDEP